MLLIGLAFASCLALLCEILSVTPDSITRDRRGNQPPPSGGVAAF
ncbi:MULTISPECIES: hypothetical protein [Bosea]|jgi:hypothetical protein|nr:MULTISPECIES: hypothetical protein [unclassified Bosea (in: a-proteobacteria)]BCB19982.1 hypothetical protein OCUBac02_28760 [Bosea sp. ANAM02]